MNSPCGQIVSHPGPSVVVSNRCVGPGWYVLRLVEKQIAAAAQPGQFVQIRCNDGASQDPLLRRPFSVYAVDRAAGTYDILYVTVGRGTRWMATLDADDVFEAPERLDRSERNGVRVEIAVEGPFGNSFGTVPTDAHVFLVGGGVGVAPLYFLALELLACAQPPRITLCMGARSASLLQGIDEFRALAIRTEAATDDGSAGYKGRVTALLASLLDEELTSSQRTPPKIFGCGPQGMNDSLRALAVERELPCEICLEAIMACGFGICFGCVAPIRKEVGGELYHRRICWEGPVFDARLLSPGIDGPA
jgi:dihydroorotate dehydrogenase electron transfer subunit